MSTKNEDADVLARLRSKYDEIVSALGTEDQEAQETFERFVAPILGRRAPSVKSMEMAAELLAEAFFDPAMRGVFDLPSGKKKG